MAFGEALLEAVGLDHSGGPPRLVIASSVEPLISRQLSSYGDNSWAPHFEELLEGPQDELLFVDYLGSVLGDFPHYPVHLEVLPAHRDSVVKGLEDHESDPHVRSKYEWLAGYHNYVCRKFAERHEPTEHEDADPEAEFYCGDAQRALEFLVPIETEQSPRPLDAERLRRLLTT